MNRINRTIFKVTLWVLATVCSVLLLLAVALLLDWPPWAAVSLALFLLGTALGALFLRRIWLRRFERVVEHDLVGEGEEGARKLDDLRLKWKQAIETLRSSHLKKHGNPLYVLPWYLLLGTSGAGKTTLLANAAVPSLLLDHPAQSPITGTSNCDWWFFNEAVAIDTTGRYVVHLDEEADHEEWKLFLRLLVKYRTREPLNGVIVTVPVDRLAAGGCDLLAEEGKVIRHRLNDMMSVLGIKFPVYLLITKCDLIPGMKFFTGLLPEGACKEAMGVVNTDLEGGAGAFLNRAFPALCDQLGTLRLGMLLDTLDERGVGDLIALPEELARLREKISALAETAFGNNRYHETPVLRGIFLSSGQPHEESQEAAENEVTRFKKAAFLHDLFTTILPHDRWISMPTQRRMEWQRVTGNLGLVSWVTVMTALCGLLTFSFVKNLSTLRRLPPGLSAVPQLRGDVSSDLRTLDAYRRVIAVVEERNRHWLVPRFGLNATLDLERELKKRFCKNYHDVFLASFDKRLADTLADLTASGADQKAGDVMVHLARRINLLKAWRSGEGSERLAAMPQPEFLPFIGETAADGTSKDKCLPGYLWCLLWHDDRSEIDRDIAFLRKELKAVVAVKGGDFQWLVGWVNRQGRTPALTLAEFWGGTNQMAQEPAVAPAFTCNGKEEIDRLVKEIATALGGGPAAPPGLAAFEKSYRLQRVAAWQLFAAGFHRGAERLRGEREWQEAAARMVTDQAPHFRFIDRLTRELPEGGVEDQAPLWLHQARLCQRMKSTGSLPLAKVAERGKQFVSSLEPGRAKGAGANVAEQALSGSVAFQQYHASLAALAPAIASRMQAHQAAVQVYGEDPVAGKSPFLAAFASSKKVIAVLAGTAVPDPAVVRLVTGPADFLWSFVRREAAVHLQTQWEEQVLGGTLGMTGQQAAPALLGQDGLVWKFVRGPAAPFLCRSQKGYRAKEALGGCLLFEVPFLGYLEKGAVVQAAAMSKQTSYTVGIEGLPTDSNSDAGVKPHATRLELQCGSSTQLLTNLNYPTGKTFNWSPDSCGDVTMQIEVGDLVLTRRYSGPQAFADFLESFPGGRRTFYPRDFPGERSALEKMGIKYIRVNYRVIGSGAVLKTKVSEGSQRPPSRIAKSWD
ncbi:type VI secretion system protein ImpL [Geomonas sp. Red32]|uniref:type VI secretion protein IcmF/TssM N-terminal domain-containing protein n=1 Tax=Geomonas sp. Red32 TaxID=2912856 RepID=UPI00202CAB79|nr:type VI secretion protein IcmF/TssM N-terminal domain-containing protein [Geomonas sp. Red32]MCM0082091.1 type VI secretion system protein ImpL [Geomonas sp. Red32]